MDFSVLFFLSLWFLVQIFIFQYTLLDFATKAYSGASWGQIESSDDTKGLYCPLKSHLLELDNSTHRRYSSIKSASNSGLDQCYHCCV